MKNIANFNAINIQMNVTGDFLQNLQAVTSKPSKLQAQELIQLLRLHPSLNPWIVKFYNIGPIDVNQVQEELGRRNFYNNEWMAFEELVLSFVRLSNQINPFSMLESFDLYASYFNDLSIAFTNKSHGYLLTPLIQDTVDIIIPMATQLDMQLLLVESRRRPRLVFLASLLLKMFNNVRSQLGAGDHIEVAKKSIMLLIGVRLCSIYFKLQNPLLCRNVFSNMNNANLRLTDFPKNQQIQYRYYLARFYMVKYQFVDAYQHFQWCLSNTPNNYLRDNANVTRVLRSMIPLGMIIGKKPLLDNISSTFYSSRDRTPRFLQTFCDISKAIERGDFKGFSTVLNDPDNYQELKEHLLLVLFAEKVPLLLLRNLVRKVWVLQGKQAKLDYDSIKIALSTSLAGLSLNEINCFGQKVNLEGSEEEIDDLVIENCLVTLIDQNLLKGKLFPRLRVVSLSKTGVFPEVAAISFVKYGNGSEGRLNYADKWME
ncbi:hypothetical protein CXQ85_004759 [Candidozyma haemuli]|uniref:Uncharacterized protein n=1 Tax=Candidozyma haemuli TaxID=45357 RepID=A0A2V1AVF0_9ASCO|nr:hypothetical protein CXQ85_004759 [[Candida] haemuloni]PVH22090.1 hypothetical protein CXQ85_004759 [[Candida] haemuloni]